MPQPLSKVDPNADGTTFSLGSSSASYGKRNSAFRLAPTFASLGMEVVVEWSHVEMDITMLFARLCGGPQQDAFQLYAELTSSGPKTAAFLRMAERHIEEAYRDVFHAARTFSKSSGPEGTITGSRITAAGYLVCGEELWAVLELAAILRRKPAAPRTVAIGRLANRVRRFMAHPPFVFQI